MKTINDTITLEEQRERALKQLPADEAALHDTFRCLLYPRIAYQIDFRLNQPEEVTILSYGFDPRAGALIPTIVCRGQDGRSFRCGIEMVHLTEQEAWGEVIKTLDEGVREMQKKLLEDTQTLVSTQLQLDIARAKANNEHSSVS